MVEDEERSIMGLISLIKSLDKEYIVQAQAKDGKKALELIRRLRPDVVITDIRMPFMDGIELINTLKKENIDAEFIITSAYSDFEYAKKAIVLGVTDYITKPITVEDMSIALERVSKKCLLKSKRTDTEQPKLTFEDMKIKANNNEMHPAIRKAIKIIDEEYALKINQVELAKRVKTTPEYFSFLFRRDTGINFSNYIKILRVEVAKKLLFDNDMKIYDVARIVGYDDSKYFCRIFKEITGVSPKNYSFRSH